MFDSETRWFIRCDTCPDDRPIVSRSPKAHDKIATKLAARRDGWIIRDDLHRCPQCVDEGRTERAS